MFCYHKEVFVEKGNCYSCKDAGSCDLHQANLKTKKEFVPLTKEEVNDLSKESLPRR